MLVTRLIGVFMSHSPIYFTKSGTIGFFVNTNSEAIMDIINPFMKSSPKKINGIDISVITHEKNRKDPVPNIENFQEILTKSGTKSLGCLQDDEFTTKYSLAFLTGIKDFCSANNINVGSINGPVINLLHNCDEKLRQSKEKEKKKEKSSKSDKNKDESGSGSDDDDDDDDDDDNDSDSSASALAKRRERARTIRESNYTRERDREARNVQLAHEVAQKALDRLQADPSSLEELKDPTQRIVTSYRDIRDAPHDQSPKYIYVDSSRDTVLFPVNSQLVPIHVSCIKNVTKSEEGEFFVLTTEFVTPTAKRLPPGSAADQTFIRSLQYRSKGGSLSETFTKIRQLQTDYKAKLKAIVSTSQMVEQPKLISMKNPTVILREVFSKPLIAPASRGRGRVGGTLTAHHNGFKYIVADKAQGAFSIEFIYTNIKACYLKRADKQNSNLILMHFEFHSPILVKKDKTSKFVQIYVELLEESYDTSRGTMNDHESERLEEEQERKLAQLRRSWNDRFAHFADQTEQQWSATNPELTLEFEVPNKALKFQGIVNKDQVDVYPTADGSLIALEASPIPFVVSLAEVEVVALERVGFGLREFDLVVVFKDFKLEPKMISSIPVQQIDTVRNFLQENNILFIESKMNISWKQFLEEVKADILGFYQDGGWLSFLQEEEDEDDDDEDDEGEGGDDEQGPKKSSRKQRQQDSDSDFELSDEESSDEEYSSDSDEDYEDSDSDGSDGSVSEGEDWSDLEDDAEQDDRRRDKGHDRGKDRDHGKDRDRDRHRDRDSSKKDKKRR
jgi:nucleosome binding factor SPN SPT16 subunit